MADPSETKSEARKKPELDYWAVARKQERPQKPERGGLWLAIFGVLLWPLWIMAIPVCRGEIRRAEQAGRSATLPSVCLGVAIVGLAFTAFLYAVIFLGLGW